MRDSIVATESRRVDTGVTPETGLALSLLVMVVCIYLAWEPVTEMAWPTTRGIADHSLISTRTDFTRKQNPTVHALFLSFKYNVNGKEYSGLKELDYSPNEIDMKLKAHDFDSGTVIPVHYNPRAPENSYLSHVTAEAPLPILITIGGFSGVFALGELFAIIMGSLRKQATVEKQLWRNNSQSG